jgi:hypothetical protein
MRIWVFYISRIAPIRDSESEEIVTGKLGPKKRKLSLVNFDFLTIAHPRKSDATPLLLND